MDFVKSNKSGHFQKQKAQLSRSVYKNLFILLEGDIFNKKAIEKELSHKQYLECVAEILINKRKMHIIQAVDAGQMLMIFRIITNHLTGVIDSGDETMLIEKFGDYQKNNKDESVSLNF